VLVGVDYTRRRMILSAQGFDEKTLGRCCIAFSREKEVDSCPNPPAPCGAMATGFSLSVHNNSSSNGSNSPARAMKCLGAVQRVRIEVENSYRGTIIFS
jgi:hypothetical protein